MEVLYEVMRLAVPARVKVSDGEAEFRDPFTGEPSDNDRHPGEWIVLPEGSVCVLAARHERTDTYMISVLPPKEAEPYGIVLRRLSLGKLRECGGARDDVSPMEDEDVLSELVHVRSGGGPLPGAKRSGEVSP